MVKTKQQLVTSRAKTYNGTNGRKYITIHETANTSKGANAQSHANLQSNGFSASWHWTVDDTQAIQSFPHTVRCWHAGDGTGSGNFNSIGIEICVNSDGNFKKAVKNAAELVKKIMKDEGIPLSKVVQHNHWSGKNCPTNLRNGSKGINWSQFKNMVSGTTTVKPNKPQTGSATITKPSKPKQTGNARIRTIQTTLNSRYKTGLNVDGFDGPKTKKALIKGLQTELNKQFKAGLNVDGLWGPRTANACVTVRNGAKGNLTWIIQARLYCLGYDPKGLDSIFGNGLSAAVRKFQGNKSINADGVPGKATFAKLFG